MIYYHAFPFRRHRCVHHPEVKARPGAKCLLSEYRDTYRNVAAPRTMPIRPDGAPKFSNEPVEGKTTNNTTYIPHQVKLPNKREREEYRKPQGDIEKTSSYTFDYIPHRTNPALTAKPFQKYIASQGPFEDGTTHNHTYIPWDLQGAMVKSMKPDNSLRSNDAKMDSKTTQQLDFPGHYGTRMQPINPPTPAFRLSSAPMEDKTTTKVDYTKKDIRPRTAMNPVYEYPTDRPRLDDMTTCNRDFTWQDGKPASSFKPPHALMKSGVPFEGDTYYKTTFKQWPLTKREIREKEIYQPPSGKFDGTTSFQRDYIKHPLCRAKLAKPDVYAFTSKQPIDDSTEHNDAFKQWNIGQPDRVRKPDGYKAPTMKFNGITNYQSHYTGDFAPPAETIRPLKNERMKGDMEFKTSYKDTYKGYRPPSCPAKNLSSGGPAGVSNGYMYAHNAHGHTFYRPVMGHTNAPMQTQA